MMNLSGSPFDYLIAFFGGILLSLTPCVYPLVPITIGYIGLASSGSKLKALKLSLLYVTGIAITYSFLGLIASLTGRIFGQISAHPVTRLLVGIIIVIFGFSMLDLFTIPFPALIKFPVLKKHSYSSTFILGLSSGLIVSPCLTPALGSILFYLSTKKNIFYGSTLLLTFAYGMGLILIIAGTFSSVLVGLPKSGKWLGYVKIACALILLAAGIYFISTAIRRF